MAHRDRHLLKEAATEVVSLLAPDAASLGIQPRRLNIGAEATGGWSAFVGRLSRRGPTLEIWADRWTGGRARRLYCGFVGGDQSVQKVVDIAPPDLAPERTITGKEVDTQGYSHLREGLPRKLFGCPVHERLWGSGYYGLYFHDPISNASARRRFSQDAARFFARVSEAVCGSQDDDNYSGIERRSVRLHRQFERRKSVADRCKQRDRFSCRVCDLRFIDRYGELGRGFAEAHHIEALKNLNDRVVTRVDDLITVCANCHRMLHRMEGLRQDWKTLRRQVRARGRS